PSTQSSYIQTRSATPQVLTDRSISAMTQMTPTSPQVINTIKIPFQPTKTSVDISHIPPYERKFKQIKTALITPLEEEARLAIWAGYQVWPIINQFITEAFPLEG
ncbi:12566_t:CDS:2, partial [Entrophospora sp. SA101]